jgi:hypothetical protein
MTCRSSKNKTLPPLIELTDLEDEEVIRHSKEVIEHLKEVIEYLKEVIELTDSEDQEFIELTELESDEVVKSIFGG